MGMLLCLNIERGLNTKARAAFPVLGASVLLMEISSSGHSGVGLQVLCLSIYMICSGETDTGYEAIWVYAFKYKSLQVTA